MKLVQRRGLERNTYDLVDDGVRIKIQSLRNGGTFVVPYTSLPHTPTETTSPRTWLMVFIILTATLTFGFGFVWLMQPPQFKTGYLTLTLASALLTSVVFVLFLVCRKRDLVYSDGNHTFSVKAKSPSQRYVADFLEKMNESKLGYYQKFLKRAMDADPTTNARSVIVNFQHGGYLTEAQADSLERALGLSDKSAESFGFVATSDSKSA